MVRKSMQMRQARKLIQQKHYEEARALLRTIHHPIAREWLIRIDAILSMKQSRELPNRYIATVG